LKIISRAVFFCADSIFTEFIDECVTQLLGQNLDLLTRGVQFRVSIPPLVILDFSYLAAFEFLRHFVPSMENIKHRKVGGSLGLIQAQADFAVNLTDLYTE